MNRLVNFLLTVSLPDGLYHKNELNVLSYYGVDVDVRYTTNQCPEKKKPPPPKPELQLPEFCFCHRNITGTSWASGLAGFGSVFPAPFGVGQCGRAGG